MIRLLSQATCQSCLHCVAAASGTAGGWCRLRRLQVHPELARVLFCHHWMPRAPVLPPLVSADQTLICGDRQLDLGASVDVVHEQDDRARVL